MRLLTTPKGQIINVEAITFIERAGPGAKIHLSNGATIEVKQTPEVLLSELKAAGDSVVALL